MFHILSHNLSFIEWQQFKSLLFVVDYQVLNSAVDLHHLSVVEEQLALLASQKVQELRSEGLSQSKVAKRLGVSVSTVKRHWNKGEE